MAAKKIVILGAGPTGLGAAYRLAEQGHRSWRIFEAKPYIGGLSASFKDEKGFTWDIGGHILFSHYSYFDDLFERLMKGGFLTHLRNSWIWLKDRFVRYPFQNNLHHLPKDVLYECLRDLVAAQMERKGGAKNFRDWIVATFGEGIARHFLLPYNFKTWATPPERMASHWIGERVSVVPLDQVLRGIIYGEDDTKWGPNAEFKFPLHGGTGGFFSRFMPFIHDRLTLNANAVKVDTEKQRVIFEDGHEEAYDYLISTIPVDCLVRMMTPRNQAAIRAAKHLVHASGCVVGIGLRHPRLSDKCWVYFPEDTSPFYRTTYFSNYSPENVPGEGYCSFMCETSYSEHKPVNKSAIIEDTVKGLVATRMMTESMRKRIVSTYLIDVEYSYPVPTLKRDYALGKILPYLEEHSILSRGRFGFWHYEIGNMDHSVMQGVEAVDRILKRKKEKVIAPYAHLCKGI